MYSIRKWFIICIRTMKGHLSASSNEKCSCSMACTSPCIQNPHDLTFELWSFSTAWNCIHVDKTGQESKVKHEMHWNAIWLMAVSHCAEKTPTSLYCMKCVYQILKGKLASTFKLASASSCFHLSGCISNMMPCQFSNARFICTHH